MATFPNVPIGLGVPTLLRNPLNIIAPVTLLALDLLQAFAAPFSQQWGLFQDGFPILTPDTVVSFDYRQNSRITDAPLELGAFESYDKVASPFGIRFRMATGGSTAARQAFLNQVLSIAGTTDLYDAVTPEKTYTQVNVEHFDYHRSASEGLGILLIDLWLTEIRENTIAAFSQTKQPQSSGQVGNGQVQPQPATPDQAAKAQTVE